MMNAVNDCSEDGWRKASENLGLIDEGQAM